jgi:methylenetetrahydrofolate dehydrogenase (NADP+)/methenyltetrahydrofolate cyclohydrolase
MRIDGKQIASEVKEETKAAVTSLNGRKPGLAFVLVGGHPASEMYVRAKKKACAYVGMHSVLVQLPASIAESDLLAQIDQLNRNPAIDGILIQLPLPSHLDTQAVMSSVDPSKDVDGFHPINVGKMLLGDESAFIPCTPHGILVLLEKSQVSVEGKHVVIVGRSNIVGKPLAALLMQKRKGCNATVTVCHSRSERLADITQTADILIAAMGQPLFIKAGMVKPGAVVIDVGINRLSDKLVGDVDFAAVEKIASLITPVPGGVGPMTIAMLLKNTLLSYQRRHGTSNPL